MADVGKLIYRYFLSKGLSPAQAAGLVGNAQQESGLRPNAPGGGLFQYIGGRAHSGRGGARQQLDATWAELTGPERHTLQALKGAKSAGQAARIFSERFERPGVPMNENRERYAKQALSRYQGKVGHELEAGEAAQRAGPPQATRSATSQNTEAAALAQVLEQNAPKPVQPGGLAAPAFAARPTLAGGPKAPVPYQAPAQADPAQAIAALLTQPLQGGETSLKAGVARAQPAARASGPGPAKGGYPLAKRGKVIGVPYQGTHTQFGNWESDNAVDIAAAKGTPVYAVEDGTIGSRIGALGSSSSQLAGLRLHLAGHGNEWYYAHLSKLAVRAGQRVKAGQLLGYSGVANGVAHLHIASKHGDPRRLTR